MIDERKIALAAGYLGLSVPVVKAFRDSWGETVGDYDSYAKEEAARHALWSRRDPRGWEPGSFTQSLFLTWGRADESNKARLRNAFPIVSDAFDILQREGVPGLAKWGGIE